MRYQLALAFLGLQLLPFSATNAADIYEHKLRVVANPAIPITDEDVDAILAAANRTMASSDTTLGWDASCAQVRLVRAGSVKVEPKVDAAGSYETLRAQLKTWRPTANVIIVGRLDCGGIGPRSGCGMAGEPLIVVAQSNLTGLLWLHERGHGMSLAHSSDALASTVGPELARRFMFWQLNKDRTGKKAEECIAFQQTQLGSVTRRSGSLLKGAISAPRLMVRAAKNADRPPNENAVTGPPTEVPTGLSEAASAIVTTPWEQVPLAAIRALSATDVETIRSHLRGPPGPFWAQALTALALRGAPDDEALLKHALAFPLPVGDKLSAEQRSLARDLLGAQLAVPVALGILAKSTGAEQPVAAIEPLTKIETAAEVIGPAAAVALRTEALKGLAVADTPAARSVLDARLMAATSQTAVPRKRTNRFLERLKNFGTPWMLQSKGAVAEVTNTEEARIAALRELIRTDGLDAALTKP